VTHLPKAPRVLSLPLLATVTAFVAFSSTPATAVEGISYEIPPSYIAGTEPDEWIDQDTFCRLTLSEGPIPAADAVRGLEEDEDVTLINSQPFIIADEQKATLFKISTIRKGLSYTGLKLLSGDKYASVVASFICPDWSYTTAEPTGLAIMSSIRWSRGIEEQLLAGFPFSIDFPDSYRLTHRFLNSISLKHELAPQHQATVSHVATSGSAPLPQTAIAIFKQQNLEGAVIHSTSLRIYPGGAGHTLTASIQKNGIDTAFLQVVMYQNDRAFVLSLLADEKTEAESLESYAELWLKTFKWRQ